MVAMTGNASWTEEPIVQPRTARWRWVAGSLVALAAVTALVLFALGFWNPWRLVVLRQHFANLWVGLAVAGVLSYVALWLLLPVRSEARQPRRITARVTVVVLGVTGLLGWGLFGQHFTYETTAMATSADGERTVVHVTHGGLRERELHVWQGTGLATREVGSLGQPCGGVRVEFADRDVIRINQGFGDWQFHLEPATGQPRHVFGPRCSDGPVPATMGP
jgi:hypothetical protein